MLSTGFLKVKICEIFLPYILGNLLSKNEKLSELVGSNLNSVLEIG